MPQALSTHLRGSVVTVNQTRSQKDKIFKNKRCYYIHKRLAIKYKHLQVWSV